MDTKDEGFYISLELSEVIDLVIDSQKLLHYIRTTRNDNHPQGAIYNASVATYTTIISKLEKLVVKD